MFSAVNIDTTAIKRIAYRAGQQGILYIILSIKPFYRAFIMIPSGFPVLLIFTWPPNKWERNKNGFSVIKWFLMKLFNRMYEILLLGSLFSLFQILNLIKLN